MPTTPDTLAYIVEQARLGSRLTTRKLFGEHALYVDGKVVALICDNTLFLKPCEATALLTATLPHGTPFPGARPYPIGDELLDDPDQLRTLLDTMAHHLPRPAPKRPRTPRGR